MPTPTQQDRSSNPNTVTTGSSKKTGEITISPSYISLNLPERAFKQEYTGTYTPTATYSPNRLLGEFEVQPDWLCCRKCQGLFYGGAGRIGNCPCGGGHDGLECSGYGARTEGHSPIEQTQSGWRWCRKCEGMFYVLNGTTGICPAGQGHDPTQSASYLVPFFSEATGTQREWKWCRKCQALFFAGTPGQTSCPAGGGHDGSQSGPYSVYFTPKTPSPKAIVLKPQIFIVENYILTTFVSNPVRSSTMIGPVVSVPPGSSKKLKLTINRNKSSVTSSSKTVLEANDFETSNSFNSNLKQALNTNNSTEEYKYKMEASFHGSASVDILGGGGNAEATVKAQGETSNVRSDVASAVASEIASQAKSAQTSRRDMTKVESGSGSSNLNEQTTEDFEQRNDFPYPVNYTFFGMVVEYVSALSLVNISVGFLNGDPTKARLEPLYKVRSLLEGTMLTEQDIVIVEKHILNCTRQVRNHMDERVDALVEDGAGGFMFNKRRESIISLTNSDGSEREILKVPGIVISVEKNQLDIPGAVFPAIIEIQGQ